jgi:hypothetical protein
LLVLHGLCGLLRKCAGKAMSAAFGVRGLWAAGLLRWCNWLDWQRAATGGRIACEHWPQQQQVRSIFVIAAQSLLPDVFYICIARFRGLFGRGMGSQPAGCVGAAGWVGRKLRLGGRLLANTGCCSSRCAVAVLFWLDVTLLSSNRTGYTCWVLGFVVRCSWPAASVQLAGLAESCDWVAGCLRTLAAAAAGAFHWYSQSPSDLLCICTAMAVFSRVGGWLQPACCVGAAGLFIGKQHHTNKIKANIQTFLLKIVNNSVNEVNR